MQVELTFSIVVNGGAPTDYQYKIEDGEPDEDLCSLVQSARERLNSKMLKKIDEECGL